MEQVTSAVFDGYGNGSGTGNGYGNGMPEIEEALYCVIPVMLELPQAELLDALAIYSS